MHIVHAKDSSFFTTMPHNEQQKQRYDLTLTRLVALLAERNKDSSYTNEYKRFVFWAEENNLCVGDDYNYIHSKTAILGKQLFYARAQKKASCASCIPYSGFMTTLRCLAHSTPTGMPSLTSFLTIHFVGRSVSYRATNSVVFIELTSIHFQTAARRLTCRL
jgi:hypothetical protein